MFYDDDAPLAEPETEVIEVAPAEDPGLDPSVVDPAGIEDTAGQELIEDPVDEPSAETPVEDDPYADYRDENGLIRGRYKTVQDALDGLKALDEEFGAQKLRFEQFTDLRQQMEAAGYENIDEFVKAQRSAQASQQLPTGADPFSDLKRVARMLPERVSLEMPDPFKTYFLTPVEQGGYGGTEEDLDILSDVGIARVQQVIVDHIQRYEQQQQLAMAADARAREEAEAKEIEEGQALLKKFAMAHPDVAPWMDVLMQRAVYEFESQNPQVATEEEYAAGVAETMRKLLAARGVTVAADGSGRRPVPRAPMDLRHVATSDEESQGAAPAPWFG